VAFSKKTGRSQHAPDSRPPTPTRVSSGLGPIVLLALSALAFSVWALRHHFAFEPKPMLVPARPAPAPTYDVDAGERPVPELGD
jgi:hypothetical protein